MTEPRTAPDEPADETRELDAYEDDWPDEPADSLPPRPRRRLVTPLSAALAAVAVAALGFVAGVEVQKAQGGTTTGSGATSARAAFAGRAGGLPGQAGGGRAGRGGASPTFGTVASKSGRTLYVKDSNGTTVKVKLAGQAKVTRSAAASAKSIHPGDTVIVQGTRSSSGTVTAARVTATSSTAASAGGGPGALFGGGARRRLPQRLAALPLTLRLRKDVIIGETDIRDGRPQAVSVRDVVVRFGEIEAVAGASFEAAEGEVYGLLGPNGAGKTTTLRVLTTLLRPTSGARAWQASTSSATACRCAPRSATCRRRYRWTAP